MGSLFPGFVPADLPDTQISVLDTRVLVFAGLHSGSFVPEGYSYIGHSSQTDALGGVVSKHESKLPASLPVRSTGYRVFVDVELSEQEAGQQKGSADKEHETLMFTYEGHLYTKP